MKNLKKILGLMILVCAVMMLTSCKTIIGGIELKAGYVVFAILSAIAWAGTAFFVFRLKKPFLSIPALVVAVFPFFWTPTQKLTWILFLIGILMAGILFFILKKRFDAEKKAENSKKFYEIKANETAKLQNRYKETLPKVKRYLDSVGFALPPDENVFFMQIDETTGKWKYEVKYNLKVTEWVPNPKYDPIRSRNSWSYGKYKKCIVTEKSPSANGILLTADGKAYIGAIQGNKTFWWHTEDGIGVDNSVQPQIHTVVAVGNITKQLLCGLHIKCANDTLGDGLCVDTPETYSTDYYWSSFFPKTVKRVFILPSDEFEKKNTVTLGKAFVECSNLRLFYVGFNKCEHEKFFCKNDTYKVFADDSHAEFISPSRDCQNFFNTERNCKNWKLKVGKTIQKAVPIEELIAAENLATVENALKQLDTSIAELNKSKKAAAAKANKEKDAKAAKAKKKAKEENDAKLAKTKPVLAQMEKDLAAKKAEAASLGMDAQAIVQKAKLNKEIKELEPKIKELKAEVERLSK
ncbi:MAG: hypothetical protein ACI4LX_01170 [Treponema sp.]